MASMMMDSSERVEATDGRDGGPLPMKFFSTWEVRKVPPNCVSRSCSLTITRLQILQEIEPGLQSVVVSVSMKTPHRSLRSNELEVPANGVMNIPQNLTFSLEYPHFLKRGGNDLQIRLQRKKRYRNRTIRGYKTLARGEVNMSLVLQKSFQGVVKLFSEKNPEPLAMVTVSSLTSTPADHQTEGVSSEEEEDELVFSDELAERGGSDSDSIENMDPSHYEEATSVALPKISLKQPSSVLRLLKLRTTGSRGNRHVPVQVTLGLEEDEDEVGGRESVATSLSDSYDEEETLSHGQTTPRPRLRPFFGSDTLSQISIPQPGDTAPDRPDETVYQHQMFGSFDLGLNRNSTRSRSPSETLEPLDMPEIALIEGRLWLVKEREDHLLPKVLQSLGEPFLNTPTECTSSSLLSLLNTLHNLWHKSNPFLLLVTGDKQFLSSLLRAYVTGPHFPIWLYFLTDVEKTLRTVSSPPTPSLTPAAAAAEKQNQKENEEDKYSHQSISGILARLKAELQYHPLPIAQAELAMEQLEPNSSTGNRSIPFIHSVIMGPWESDTELIHPSSPSTSTDPVQHQLQHHEIHLEYWGGKKDSQKSSVKVRSVMATVVPGPLLSITAIIRKKGGIRIRRSKDTGGESSIISVTASHVMCRSSAKNESINATIDGLEWQVLTNIKLSAQWSHTPLATFPRATCQTPSQ